MPERSGTSGGGMGGFGAGLPVELFEATTDCVVVLDAEWRFAYLNSRAVAELQAEGVLGTVIWQSFPNAVGSKFEEIYRRVAERRESETFEAFYPPPLNAWYEVHAVPFQGSIVAFFRNITKRRSAAEALLRRHNELDTILSRAGVGIMQYADNHRLIVINEQFCKILGRTPEELDGRPMETFTHPDDVPANSELLEKHRQSASPFYIRKRYLRPNGEIVWCSVAISFVRHSDTNEPTTIVVAIEVTDEMEAQQRAEDTRALLQAVVDNAEDLIFVKDTAGRFMLANKKMRADFDVAVGQQGGDRFPSVSLRFNAEDRQVMKNGRRLVVEEEIHVPDGVRTFQTIKVPWQRNGTTKGIIGISRDLSDRVRQERALRDSEERFRLAALATRDVIWEWDIARGTIEWSSLSADLTGDTPGTSFEWWSERVHPDDREAVVSGLIDFIEGSDQRWEREYRFLRPDRSYGCVFDRAFVVRDEEKNAIRMIGAMSDITERVNAQERINKLQRELVHISRISAMETMGSALAHEVNQPLTAAGNYLLGASRMIAAGEPFNSSEICEGLDQAQTEIMRASEIIRRLRRMVEHGTADTCPVSLLNSVHAALGLAFPQSRSAGIAVSIEVSPDLEVMADAVQLQQVLFNLIRNSADAVAHRQRKHIGISARRQGGEIVVQVTDTGEGVQPDAREHLFSAFASTKPGGLGVGLSICRTIIEAHRGKIWVENGDSGEGATFSFTVPAAGAAQHISSAESG